MSKAFCDMRVFLSSTKQDLEAEREIVFYALDGIGHEVVRMEEYGSRTLDSWKVCEKELDRCDAYVLLIGTRYGSELTETALSYTHAEFERAKIKGIPIAAFIKAGLPDKRASADAKRLNEFVDLVNASYNVRRPNFEIRELGAAVREGVANLESDGRSDPPRFTKSAARSLNLSDMQLHERNETYSTGGPTASSLSIYTCSAHSNIRRTPRCAFATRRSSYAPIFCGEVSTQRSSTRSTRKAQVLPRSSRSAPSRRKMRTLSSS
jgi:hypothetical protein